MYHWDRYQELYYLIFSNDRFLFIKKASLHSYADDNTLFASVNNIGGLIEILKDDMILPSNDSLIMFISKERRTLTTTLKLHINNSETAPQSSVALIRVTIDNQTETKMVVGLLSTSKMLLLIIDNQAFLQTLKILFQIYYYLNQNPSLWALSTDLLIKLILLIILIITRQTTFSIT